MTTNAANPNDDRLKRALAAIKALRTRVGELEHAAREPIAIIGTGCRLPGGIYNAADLWQLLAEGRSAVGPITSSRWLAEEYFNADPDVAGRMYTRWGGMLEDVAAFDAKFFGISPREAASMDPQHRIMLEVCWEALENAGLPPGDLAGTRGAVIAGMTLNDYDERLRLDGPESIGPYNVSGNCLNFATGRVAYTLGWHGPSMAVDSACSSSLVAVHLACRSLRQRETDLALAGGVNVILSPDHMIMMCKNRMAAADGRCKTFDAAADGYVRGEGCAMIVLKRLSDALADGDFIHAVIRGSAINHDGPSSGLTVPNGLAQQALMRAALEDAELEPGALDFLEAHGTGTPLGDPIEVSAVDAVYGQARDAQAPLALGSIKTNLGHLESAAGITGLLKVVTAIMHEQIPPTLNLEQLNPQIITDPARILFPTELVDWPSHADTRVGAVSSFGASGTNAHIIIEQAPAREPRGEVIRGRQLLCLSARSPSALAEQAKRYGDFLTRPTAAPVHDVCFTAAAGRTHFEHRLAVSGSSAAQLALELDNYRRGTQSTAIQLGEAVHPESTDIVFLFTGQGAQYPGMGADLFRTEPVFRAALERCDEILGNRPARRLLDVMFAEDGAIHETAFTQPALFAFEYALAELWRYRGVVPTVVAGHSIGEYAAAYVAGVMSLDDALTLVAARGRLMQSLSADGAMAAVFAGVDAIREVLEPYHEVLSIAAVNGPANTTISGSANALEQVVNELERRGLRCRRLTVSHAFHSPLMDPMLDEFRTVAQRITYSAPQIRLLSNVTGGPLGEDRPVDADYWCQHVRAPVRFADNMAWLREKAFTWFVEIGPGATLLTLGRQCIPDTACVWVSSIESKDDVTTDLSAAFASLYVNGFPVDWNKFHRDSDACRTELPTYPFEKKTYWLTPDQRSQTPWRAQTHQSLLVAGTADVETIRRDLELSGEFSEDELSVLPRLLDALKTRAQRGEAMAAGRDWMVRPDWEPVAAEQYAEVVASGRRCVIIGIANSASFDLQNAIERAGNTCEFVDIDGAAALESADLVAASDIILLGIDGMDPTPELTGQAFAPFHETLCRGVLAVLRKLARTPPGTFPPLWLFTRGAIGVAPDQPVRSPQQALLWGLAKVIPLELPDIWGGILDLDPAGSEFDADLILRAMRNGAKENELALRGEKLYAARLHPYVPEPATEPVFSPTGSYLITGGLGGLGLKLAEWLVSHGAKNLILTGRSHTLPDATHDAIRRLERAGARVAAETVDVCDFGALDAMLQRLEPKLGRLRGIAHCAGIVNNQMLLRSEWADFAPVLAAKVTGGWNLHELTLERELDWFLLYSTCTSLIGSDGQGNYAAANAFLDALAHYRHGLGLPATSLNWGPWAEIGLASYESRAAELAAARGLSLMPSDAAIAALGPMLKDATAQIGIIDADWQKVGERFTGAALPSCLRSLTDHETDLPAAARSSEPGVLAQTVQELNVLDRRDYLIEHVARETAVILGFDDELPNATLGLFDIGMDSLMAVELGVRLGTALNRPLPATLAFDHPTIEQIADYLLSAVLDLTGTGEREVTGGNGESGNASASLIEDIKGLSDEELEGFLDEQLKGL